MSEIGIMGGSLSSRERFLLAINHSESDHVPLCFKFWGRPFLLERDRRWSNQFERVEKTLKFGLDDTVGFEPPRPLNLEVKIRRWRETPPGERYPLLFKEYETPRGTLRQVVRQTEDWPFGEDIPLCSDFNVPRSKKFLIKSLKDLEPLSCLFREPTENELKAFHREAGRVARFSERHGVLVECGDNFTPGGGDDVGILGADALPWLCGIRNAMVAALRNPEFVHRLLDIILEWDMRYVRLLQEADCVDVIVHRGWYENTHFWTLKTYRTFIMPRLRKLIELVHKSGAKFCYIMSTGLMPLLETFKEMGVDILYGVDPVQGGADLLRIKREVGDRICLWGGVNSAITLGRGNKEEIEEAVTKAIGTLAPGGGFILSAIDQLFDYTPSENVIAMVEAWRRRGAYPIQKF